MAGASGSPDVSNKDRADLGGDVVQVPRIAVADRVHHLDARVGHLGEPADQADAGFGDQVPVLQELLEDIAEENERAALAEGGLVGPQQGDGVALGRARRVARAPAEVEVGEEEQQRAAGGGEGT